MGYFINPDSYRQAFTVPALITDECLKLATHNQLKVILAVMRNASDEILADSLSKNTGVSVKETEDALLYWAQKGILNLVGEQSIAPAHRQAEKTVVKQDTRPTRQDVARRGLEDPKLKMLLSEAQLKFGRNLKSNEARTLVWLYDDLGLDVSLILLLLQYAIGENRLNINFIEKIAALWVENSVENISAAEKWISSRAVSNLAWKRVSKAFGIENRRPSEKEAAYSALWLSEWGLNDDLLELAYEVCVDAKSKFLFGYAAKIIESWHKKGYKCAADVKKSEKQPEKGNVKTQGKYSYAAYDLDAFEKMLNSDDD